MNPQEEEILENLIDLCGVKEVIESLKNVCFKKSEHIRTHWQDEDTAWLWRSFGEKLLTVLDEEEDC